MKTPLDRAKIALWNSLRAVCRNTPDLDEHNRETLIALSHWLVDAPHEWIVPGKGVALRGPVGTGKTDMMKALSRAMVIGGAAKGFDVINTRRIVAEYNRTKDDHGRDAGGDAVILKYAEFGPLCFDDLALEQPGRHYGKESNVIADILSLRYERWRSSPERYATYFTTNADNAGLSDIYDDRTLSRLGEWCAIVPLGGPDRRESAVPAPRLRTLFAEHEAMPELTPEQHSAQCARLREVVSNAAKEIAA